jgi:hypothetical protein
MNSLSHQDIPIAFVPTIAAIVWPKFVTREGCIFIDFVLPRKGRKIDKKCGSDRTGVEGFYNHVHILDLFKHDKDVWNEERKAYRTRHPHFKMAEQIGKIIVRAWFCKLRMDFPRDDFRVYYTRDDDPIVRLHRIYDKEPLFMSEKDWSNQISKGTIIILDTRSTKTKKSR